jgi:hypothetical protein
VRTLTTTRTYACAVCATTNPYSLTHVRRHFSGTVVALWVTKLKAAMMTRGGNSSFISPFLSLLTQRSSCTYACRTPTLGEEQKSIKQHDRDGALWEAGGIRAIKQLKDVRSFFFLVSAQRAAVDGEENGWGCADVFVQPTALHVLLLP